MRDSNQWQPPSLSAEAIMLEEANRRIAELENALKSARANLALQFPGHKTMIAYKIINKAIEGESEDKT